MVTDAVVDARFESPAQTGVTWKVKFTPHDKGKPRRKATENLYILLIPLNGRKVQ